MDNIVVADIKVSIIVPMYNSEDFINDLLDQLEAQTQDNIEIICVDDGSTDKTARIVLSRCEINSAIHYFYQENSGAGVARNLGMQYAKGKYFMCLDADDLYDPKLVETLYQKAELNMADMAVCAFSRKNYWTNICENDLGYRKDMVPSNRVFSSEEFENPFILFNQGPINKMYRKDFIEQIGVSYSSTHMSNDVLFYCAAIVQAKRIVFEKENLVTVRRYVNGNSISSRRGEYLTDFIYVYKELYEYLCKCGLEKKYQLEFLNMVKVSVNYNCQYKYSPDFVKEFTQWLMQKPWCDLTKAEIQKFFNKTFIDKKRICCEH